MFLRVLISILFLGFLIPGALAEEDFLVLDDPREFVGECSFETATPITFEEAALNYENHLGECVLITGYYTGAFYDGIDGYYKTNGDEWIGIDEQTLKRNRIGLYLIQEPPPSFYEDELDQNVETWRWSWSTYYGIDKYKLRILEVAATLYSCDRWVKDAGKEPDGLDYLFRGYCHYATGAILAAHDWREVGEQKYDPVWDSPYSVSTSGKFFEPLPTEEEQECQWETAKSVGFRELVLKPYKYFRKCVRVRGYSRQSLNFLDEPPSYYLFHRRNEEDYYAHLLGTYVLVDMKPTMKVLYGTSGYAELVGRIGICEQFSQAANSRNERMRQGGHDYLFWVSGYCHAPYGAGTYMEIHDARLEKEFAFHLEGEENRERYGNLALPPADWGFEKAVLKEAKKSFWEQVEKEQNKPLEADETPLNRLKAIDPELDLTALEFIILIDQQYYPYFPGEFTANVCYCLEETCQDKWPLSNFEMNYGPTVAFFCINVDRYLTEDGSYDFTGYSLW